MDSTRSASPSGDTVVIQGAGGLGLYATAVAREMGAGKIIVLDRPPGTPRSGA